MTISYFINKFQRKPKYFCHGSKVIKKICILEHLNCLEIFVI